MPRSAESRILEFLTTYPDQPLRVAVGYVSVWGLAWLARHTDGRPVELLIGDCRKRRFQAGTEIDRNTVREFLSRDDVEVKNWYATRTENRSAHIKAWQTTDTDGQTRILSGSANLSQQGLLHNTEAMGEYSGEDLNEAFHSMNDLFAKSWDAKDRVLGYLSETAQPSRSAMWKEVARTSSARSTDNRRRSTQSAARSPARSPHKQSRLAYGRRPPQRRHNRRRPRSNRRKSTTNSGLLSLWWRMPKRYREAALSFLGVVIVATGIIVWLNVTDSDTNESQLTPEQPSPSQTSLPQPSPPTTQSPPPTTQPELQRAEGVSCQPKSNSINLPGRQVRVIRQTICTFQNPNGSQTYWQCTEVRGWDCYGGEPDPCVIVHLGYPFSPATLQGIMMYTEPLPDCQGGFEPSEWGLPNFRQIVPASEAWRSGGFNWDTQQKQDFITDTENIWEDGQPWPTISDNSATLQSSAPPESQCQLTTRWADIKKKYELHADPEEVATLRELLTTTCK